MVSTLFLTCVLLQCERYLYVVAGAALSSIALDLERTLEAGRNPEAGCDLHMPATIQMRTVVLGEVGGAEGAPVYMKKASTT